ncbi:toxin C-terminal domain-containing protein [Saccharothrix sp. AJ9571]|nr:toxin C-terminal domain-containing protein [Saccharothrix sp. AJ9571]
METTRNSAARSLLYGLSGGAISIFFVLTAAAQAQAAPAPHLPPSPEKKAAENKAAADKKQVENRKAVDAGQSGRNEQTGKKQRQTAAKKAEEKRQVENRRRVDAGPSGRNEQTGKREREVRAEKKKAEDEKKVAERKVVDAGPSGRNEQTDKRKREVRAEKKRIEDDKKIAERKAVDAGPSGRNEQTDKRKREAEADRKSRAEEYRRQLENRRRVDAGPSGRNEQTGKREREVRAEKKRIEDEKKVAERKAVDAGPSGRNEQLGKRARQARAGIPGRAAEAGGQSAAVVPAGQREEPSRPERRGGQPARFGPQVAQGAADLLRGDRPPNEGIRERISRQAVNAEEAIERGLADARGWAQDQIEQERRDPEKFRDLSTGLRRAAAGLYASGYDNANALNDAVELLGRAEAGDPQAQREIEQGLKDTADGISKTAADAWNDPRGAANRAAERVGEAVDDFMQAPVSGTGGLVGDLLGPGKITKPMKAVDGLTPDRDSGRPTQSEPGSAEPAPPGAARPAEASSPAAGGGRDSVTPAPSSRGDSAAPAPSDSRDSVAPAPSSSRDSVAPAPSDSRDSAGRAGDSETRSPESAGDRAADRRSSAREVDSRRSDDRADRGPVSLSAATEVPNLSRADRGNDSDSGRDNENPPGADNDQARPNAAESNAAPSCSKNSFVPGTLVLLADGSYKPIEQVTLGDQVLATDPVTGLTQARAVIDLIPGQGLKHLVRITVDTDGDRGDATGTVTATDEHPFWVAGPDRWTDAEDLNRGNLLRTPDGRLLEVVAVHEWTQPQHVHNLTVEGLHTYYVLVGGLPVLVHNCNLPEGYRSTPAFVGDPYHPDTVAARSADNQRLYGPTTADRAAKLGFTKRIPAQKAPFDSHGQVVYSNGKYYITPDVDGHNVTNGWKVFNRRGQRIGTYDSDLNYIKE